ncbi:MAG: transglutaminase-like domain-containing protein [Planctomycetaceae bacterium]
MHSLLLPLLLIAPALSAAEPTPPAKETWQSIALRGQRIGYGHLVERRTEQPGGPIITTDMRLHTVMKRFDGKLTLIIDQTVVENLDGTLRSFTFRMENPPASRMEMRGRVDGTTLELTTTTGGQSSTSQLTIPAGVKSPVYVDRMLEDSRLSQGESQTINLFDPQLGAAVTVKATGQGPADFQLPDGQQQQGTMAVVEYVTGIPGMSVDCYFDAQGQSVLNEAKLLGTTTWNVSREQALKEIPADIDLGLAALVEVDKIPDSDQLKSAIYRVSLDGGLADNLIAASNLQNVERIDPDTIRLTVKSLRPGQTKPTDSSPPDAKYLAATAMARSDDEAIVKLATESAPADAASNEVATALETRVHKWLNRKNMSSNLASASEVVRSREGDCTEHAVLLTALLRARGIPARTAVGLVYWDQFTAFAGHAWTEAWLDGEWIPLDATQAHGGIGADHIKLGDSSLADGDAGIVAGSISTWQLLDRARIKVESTER